MRAFLIIGLFVAIAGAAQAQVQEQEGKLMDRLLRPDMNLKNSDGAKQFDPGGGPLAAKKAHTKTFYVAPRAKEKNFRAARQLELRNFRTRNSVDALKQADTTPRASLTSAIKSYPTHEPYATRQLSDSKKKVATTEFSGTRPFLVRGKSQKSLDTPSRAMSIDEVRELLNKNK